MKLSKNVNAERSVSQPQRFSSEAIDLLRFPLAVMVVFIHSFSDGKWLDFSAIDYGSLSPFDVYNLLRRFLSNVFPAIAVPAFFFISGYLFFKKLESWNGTVWKRKMRSRLRTLVIPYLIWVTLYILYSLRGIIKGVLFSGRPILLLTDWMEERGYWHLYWDSKVWGGTETDWLGNVVAHSTGPHLVPLWFLRDLMVIVALTPLVYWLIKKAGIWAVLFFGIAYVTGVWPDIHGLRVVTLFFFSAGAYISIKGYDISVFFKSRYPLLIACMVLLAANMYCSVGAAMEYQKYFSRFYVITGVLSAINISYWLVKYKCIRSNRLLVESCFFVYAFHLFILGNCRRLVEPLLGGITPYLLPVAYLLFPLLDVLICVVLFKLLQRYIPCFTKVLTGGR